MTNNNGIEIYIEKDTLSTLNSIEELIIDGKEFERYGQKTARLTLIKNYLKKWSNLTNIRRLVIFQVAPVFLKKCDLFTFFFYF